VGSYRDLDENVDTEYSPHGDEIHIVESKLANRVQIDDFQTEDRSLAHRNKRRAGSLFMF
jgi:hypothetical protein